MGVSFKISKRGTKFKPKPVISESKLTNEGAEISLESSKLPSKNQSNGKDEDAVGLTGSSMSSGRDHSSADDEVSFILNLYPDGYSIGKAPEIDNGLQAAHQEGLKLLHPYDRTSEGLFAAIESGRLPGSILDDIPCKFVEGAIICEVRDFRKCMFDPRSSSPSPNGSVTINKVHLKMSLENVVKDIPLMADDSWTYGDLMEVESQILKALQPKLCLDPVPRLDRLCRNPPSLKINLGLVGLRKRRLRQIPEVSVKSNNRPHGKKICIDRAPETSSYNDVMSQHSQDTVAAQAGFGNLRKMHHPGQGLVLPPGNALANQDMPISYANNTNSTITGKMESQEGQLSPYSTSSKRAKHGSGGPDGAQQQQVGSFVDGFQGADVQWRNQLLQQQQPNARGNQYGNPGLQKFTQHVPDGFATQDGVKLEPSLLKPDVQMEGETSHMDPRAQERFQHPFMRPAFQQAGWSNLTQQAEKDPRKEDQFPKRKSGQSPRLSTGAVAQSPLSAKSAEMSCGSMGTQYGAASSAGPLGQGQREKSGMTSIPAAGRATSITSSANDFMQHQHQAQLAAKRRSNSLPKTPIISGVGSPSSVNTMGVPMNAASPSFSTPQLTEQSMLERFSKIEVVAMRHQLNCKKKKADEFARKPRSFPSRELLVRLAGLANNEYSDDSRIMSKSLVGGHMNVCKIRVVNVRPGMQGNMLPGLGTRLIMSEKPNDGVVAMHYGDLTDGDYLNVEDHLPTLPNTHWADLLAAQFCALIIREGYAVDEVIQPRPPRLSIASNNQANAPGVAPNNSAVDTQQFPEPLAEQRTENKPTISNTSLNSTANVQPSSGMLPPGNSQPLQMSQGLVSGVNMPPRQQQMDQQQPLQQQPAQQQLPLQNQPSLMQQQAPQFQRSPLMMPSNPMPQLNAFGQSSNLPMGNHMGNKSSPLQMQMLQQSSQQQQQQQPAQIQRRMMMGLGPAMGIGNNMVGLGGLSNVMGLSGARGIGGAGISAPMGSMSGMGSNMGQNLSQANAISQHLRAGTLNPQAANAIQRFKMLQQRGAMLAGTQSGVASMSGAGRQMQPGAAGLSSMFGQSLNRGNISQLQRAAALGQMGQMGMPKLMPGMNVSLSQPQLQLQHQHLQLHQMLQQQQQQQQQQHQQQPQQQMQQQEATSPLQAVLSPQQVSSPSTLGISQQMNQQLTPPQQPSPQQMGQRTPMSPPLSSGPMNPIGAGNPELCPASPALSSQTLGSVGSITNSPMELQGVNKSNSNA